MQQMCNEGVKYDDFRQLCSTKTKASEEKPSSFYNKKTEQSNYEKIQH